MLSFLVVAAFLGLCFLLVQRAGGWLQRPPKGLRDFGHWFRLSVLADLGYLARSVKNLRYRRRHRNVDWDEEARRFLQGDS